MTAKLNHTMNRNALSALAALRLLLLTVTVTVAAARPLVAQSKPFQQAGREERIRTLVTKPHAINVFAAQPHDHADNEDAGTPCNGLCDESRCVELPEMSVMYDPGATVEEIIIDLSALPDDELFDAFQTQGSRWSFTATDGSVAVGQRLTITYSFVPDGTLIATSANPTPEASNLFAQFDANFPGGRAAWKSAFAQAFNRWSELTNITYVEVEDDGAAFPSSPGLLGGPGVVGRGDVRISMRTLGTPLAVNFYPQFGGDMVMDSLDIAQFCSDTNNFRALRNVLMHEHGHGLGLRHVEPANGTKLMEPFLATGFDGPQEDDIRGAQFIYGDRYEPNEGYGSEAFVGGPLNSPGTSGVQVFEIDDVSLERSGESDWYGFTAFAGVPIAIRVDPAGTTYEQGPQGGTAALVNAKATRNLGLRLWRRVSAQTGQLSLLAQIDFNAAGQSEYHPPITYTLAGYMLAEVYSTDNVNDVQRYKLTVSNSAIEAPVESPSMSVFNIAAGQQVFDGTTVQFGQVNISSTGNVTLSIANGGPGALEIGQIVLAGPGAGDYSFTLIGNPVQSGNTASLGISFQPSAAGARPAVMTLPNNDPTQPNFSFILSGTGVQPAAPAIEVSINDVVTANNGTVDFGDVELGQSDLRSLRIRNTGNAQLNVTNVTIVGAASADFSTTLLSASIAPGGSVTGTVTFTPSEANARQAELRIFSDTQPSPFMLALAGSGFEQVNNEDDENGDDGADNDADEDGDNDVDQDDDDADDLPPQGNEVLAGGGLCGIGSAMPMMLGFLGLCGMGLNRSRR